MPVNSDEVARHRMPVWRAGDLLRWGADHSEDVAREIKCIIATAGRLPTGRRCLCSDEGLNSGILDGALSGKTLGADIKEFLPAILDQTCTIFLRKIIKHRIQRFSDRFDCL